MSKFNALIAKIAKQDPRFRAAIRQELHKTGTRVPGIFSKEAAVYKKAFTEWTASTISFHHVLAHPFEDKKRMIQKELERAGISAKVHVGFIAAPFTPVEWGDAPEPGQIQVIIYNIGGGGGQVSKVKEFGQNMFDAPPSSHTAGLQWRFDL
jgi:hypothetical protein